METKDRRRTLSFNYTGASGLDLIASWFLSEYRLARRIAWKLTRKGGVYHGLDVEKTRFVIQMPRGSYEIVNYDGNMVPRIRPCASVPGLVGF